MSAPLPPFGYEPPPSGGLCAVLGPTNTGKTHYALERMCAYKSGMIGLPLRLLAREIYERLVAIKGEHAVALITGEEKIIPRLPAYFVATVEAMPLERSVEFLAVDEIQLCADPERGHVFTERLLKARGQYETLFMGAASFGTLLKRLLPEARIMGRDRLSALSYNGSRKLTRLPKRSAIIAFSTPNLYAIGELIRRQRGGAAVVMGSLSPRTRNAQVALFQGGEVEFLVATDAIGMGLNMNIDHVAFSALSKFDGRRHRHLTAQELAQIAGRAGRFTQSGTFGVTGESPELDEDLVAQIEQHRFDPVEVAQWRNDHLDFSSPEALITTLGLAASRAGLVLAPEALDERALKALAQDEILLGRMKNPISLRMLWETLQLPDFRKLGQDDYLSLIRFLFEARLKAEGVPEDWFSAQLSELARTDGDIDTLSARLAHGRTLNYIANRPGWLKRAEHWRGVTLEAENALSDHLHQALMQRFIDQKTSVLLRALSAETTPVAEVDSEGTVRLEGERVGKLSGFEFVPETDATTARHLRRAAHRAVTPVLTERLKALAQAPSRTLKRKGKRLYWQGAPVADILSSDPCVPHLRFRPQLDQPVLEARCAKRLNDYLTQLSRHELKALWALKSAAAREDLTPEARGLIFRLYENGGIVLRSLSETLTPETRAVLKGLDVRIGRFTYVVKSLQSRQARDLLQALDRPVPTEQARLSLKGQVGLSGHAPVGLAALDKLDQAMSLARWDKGRVLLTQADIDRTGLDITALTALMTALGFHGVPAPAVMPDLPEPKAQPDTIVDTAMEPVITQAEITPEAANETRVEPDQTTKELDSPTIEAEARTEPDTSPAPAPPSWPPVLAFAVKPPRPPRPARHTQAPRSVSKPGKPDRVTGDRGTGKPDAKGLKRDKRQSNKPENRPTEPYINPYSPFAILRGRF